MSKTIAKPDNFNRKKCGLQNKNTGFCSNFISEATESLGGGELDWYDTVLINCVCDGRSGIVLCMKVGMFFGWYNENDDGEETVFFVDGNWEIQARALARSAVSQCLANPLKYSWKEKAFDDTSSIARTICTSIVHEIWVAVSFKISRSDK